MRYSAVIAILSALTLTLSLPSFSVAAPASIRVTRKNRDLMIRTDQRLPNRKLLVCFQRTPRKASQPGWLRRKHGIREWVAFRRTRKNKEIHAALKEKCAQHVPPPSECKAPAGFAGISSAETFASLSDPKGKYFLCNDIVFDGPISPLMGAQAFEGILDGNGKSIRGLQISRAADPSIGLFRVLKGATIKNLTFVDPDVHGLGVVGVLAGVSSATIEHVTITGGSVTSERYPAGALIGAQFTGQVLSSTSNATVTVQGQSVDLLLGVSVPSSSP